MSRTARHIVVAFVAVLAVSSVLGAVSVAVMRQNPPSIEQLQEQIRQAEEEIRLNTALLEKTKKENQASQSELKLVRSRITARKKKLSSLEEQISLINGEISEKNNNVTALRREVDELRNQYAAMLKSAYKNYKLNDFMLFLFAAEDFNDATRRVDFMRRYNRMRVKKAESIAVLSDSITGQIRELGSRREELDGTKKEESAEISALGKDEGRFNSSIAELRKKETQINKKLKQQQELIDKAQKEIARIIAAQTKKNDKETLTDDESRYLAELSGKFDENQGRIPYPVNGGVITDHYGRHKHPLQPNLTVDNKGVNITGEPGAPVNCVFEGTVSGIYSVPMYNTCVTVRHGDYITLYANLASVSVKTGDNLSAGQRIGRLADGEDDRFLHFEIWNRTTNLNPEQWLRR